VVVEFAHISGQKWEVNAQKTSPNHAAFRNVKEYHSRHVTSQQKLGWIWMDDVSPILDEGIPLSISFYIHARKRLQTQHAGFT
jgi:hypothetical protein